MQDYLAEQEPLITEFTLSVEPPPALVEFECTRACTFPTFNVDTLDGTLFEIEVGEGWEFTLPKPAPHTLGYDVWYETVELNGANLFATYVKEWSKIIIQADKTTEANIGDYAIWLRLVDEAGKFSQLLTIQLSITGELQNEFEVEKENTVGETYEELLEERLRLQEELLSQAANGGTLRPKAEITDDITRKGLVKVNFSKKMQVFANFSISSEEQWIVSSEDGRRLDSDTAYYDENQLKIEVDLL